MTATELDFNTDDPLPASLARTMPGSAYADLDHFRHEEEHIFGRHWFGAARADELDKPGSYRTIQIGRESVLLVRDRSGCLGAFLNTCRHRGAQLCVEPAGQVRNVVRCLYHAWTYGLDGALIAVLNLDTLTRLDPANYGLHRLHLHEWPGTVWVSLADDSPDFDQTVKGAVAARLGGPDVIDAWHIEGLQLGQRHTYQVKANWKLIIENFMECYHCATIHPELIEVLPEFADGYAAQYYVGHGAQFGPDIDGFTIDGTQAFPALPHIDPDHDRRYYAITVNPQVFINLVPDHVIFHRMYPTAPDRTIVECDWLFTPEVASGGADLARSVELFHRVNQQDFEASRADQDGLFAETDLGEGVDGANPLSLGRLCAGLPAFPPATAAALLAMLDHYEVVLSEVNAVVVDRSTMLGKPTAQLLVHRDTTVTNRHQHSKGIVELIRQGHVLVVAVGRAGLITSAHVTDGATGIDVGTNPTENGLVDDVDYDSMLDRAAGVTPVLGGIGPVSTALLLSHTVQAATTAAGSEHRKLNDRPRSGAVT